MVFIPFLSSRNKSQESRARNQDLKKNNPSLDFLVLDSWFYSTTIWFRSSLILRPKTQYYPNISTNRLIVPACLHQLKRRLRGYPLTATPMPFEQGFARVL